MKIRILTVFALLLINGCASMNNTQSGTLTGGALGAGAGAAIGGIIGGGKGAAIGAGSGAVLGAGAGYLWSQRMEEQKKQMEAATAGTGVEVSQTEDTRLKLNIPSDISFDSGKSNIKSNLQPILDSFATTLKNNPNTVVPIIGHTDNTGSDSVNNPLSINRASSTRDYLANRGVAINRIQIDGRGSREPLAANDVPANRAKNRRVEIFVSEIQPPPSGTPVAPPQQ